MKGEGPWKRGPDLTMTDVRETLNERGKTHGDYRLHAAITQSIKHVMWGMHEIDSDAWSTNFKTLPSYHRETLDMIAHKIGRILAGDPDFKDHWLDIAGYATLSADRCSK